MDLLIYIFLFIFGTAFGSFGSVLIRRLKSKVDTKVVRSILYGRSQCPNCDSLLQPLDLIPIFSWLGLKGKCRYCNTKIPFFYVLLEILSGFVFAFSFYILKQYLPIEYFDIEFIVNLLFMISINWVLLLLIFADLLFYELNIYLWMYGILLSIIAQFFGAVGDFKIAFIGSISFFLLFFSIYYFAKFYVRFRFGYKDTEGFGGGDVMVGFMIGLMLPFVLRINNLMIDDIYKILILYTFLSSFLGIIFSIGKYFLSKGNHGQAIPFLPAMIFAYWFLLAQGEQLMGLFDLFKI